MSVHEHHHHGSLQPFVHSQCSACIGTTSARIEVSPAQRPFMCMKEQDGVLFVVLLVYVIDCALPACRVGTRMLSSDMRPWHRRASSSPQHARGIDCHLCSSHSALAAVASAGQRFSVGQPWPLPCLHCRGSSESRLLCYHHTGTPYPTRLLIAVDMNISLSVEGASPLSPSEVSTPHVTVTRVGYWARGSPSWPVSPQKGGTRGVKRWPAAASASMTSWILQGGTMISFRSLATAW